MRIRQWWRRHKLRRLYQPLKQRLESDPTKMYDGLIDIMRLLGHVSLDKSHYRAKIRFKVTTKTVSAGDLFNTLERITNAIRYRFRDLERYQNYQETQTRTLDAYLVDLEEVPIDGQVACRALQKKIEAHIQQLEYLRKQDPIQFEYTVNALLFLHGDLVEFAEKLIELEIDLLGASHE